MRSICVTFILFFTLNAFTISKIDSLLQITKNKKVSYEDKVKAYNLLSGHYNRISLDTSLFFADKSFDLSSAHNYKEGMSKAYLNKALTYSFFQDKDAASKHYKTAISYAEQTHDMDLRAMAMLNYSIYLLQNGSHTEALDWLNKTKDFANTNQLPEWTLKALNSIGNANMQLSDYSKAQVAFFEA